jgi:dipeptidyl aminopeptidase/acylaminoacyl peptidase
MSRPSPAVLIACLFACTPSVSAQTGTSPAESRVHSYGPLALSPAGDRIATVESSESPVAGDNTPPHGVIVIRSVADGTITTKLDPVPTGGYSSLTWSPDGKTLAFLTGDATPGDAVIDTVDLDGKLQTVATIQGLVSTPRWSPDGSTLAVLATLGAHKQTGATQAGVPQVGEIGTVHDEQRIAVFPATGGSLRLVSPADTFVYEYDWTPDGRGFVATTAVGNGDDNWWVAKLDAIDAASGTVREIAAPKVQINAPHVSPDGKTVAFIGGLMSDFGSVGGDIYTVPLAGGTPTDVTPGFAGSFNSLTWRGTMPLANALMGEKSAAVAIEPIGHKTQILWSAAVSGRVAFSDDGTTGAVVVQDYEHAPQILAGPLTVLRPLTHDNDGIPPPPYSARSVAWTNGGFHIQGWLLGPPTITPGMRYPMIVLVHGGPGAAATQGYGTRGTVGDLIAHGYFVFQPNPRGSFGQGEAFTRANIRDFGGGDLSDILAGVDAVEKIAPIDDQRLGIYGHSYGGFMSMWAVTHTQRFHAAVAGAGVSNWISYYGENGIDQWMLPFFGASAYDDPAIYLKLSPIETIKQAKTPTFIYVGERDVECPAPQSVEFWHGLRAMNVPTSLVIYEGEGHGIRSREHNRDLNTRILDWFDKYLGKKP